MPVRALKAWIAAGGIASGALFRTIRKDGAGRRMTGEAVSQVVKKHAASIGRHPAEWGGHSLRRGFCTAAANAGATELAIMKVTGHRSSAMAREYIAEDTLFENNATGMLGL